MARPWVFLLVFAGALTGLGCVDPCTELAQRICDCEATAAARQTCRRERITAQSGAVEVSEAEAGVCAAALETCTCAALDEDRLAACAFTVPAGRDGAAP